MLGSITKTGLERSAHRVTTVANSSVPTSEEILAAISDSGYLMEQCVATRLESLGFHVTTNVAYEDPDEGKSRETDVRAIKRVGHNEAEKVASFVELLVECKSGTNPHVFVTRPKNQSDAISVPAQFRFPFRYEMIKYLDTSRASVKNVAPFFHLGFDRIHYNHRLSTKAVQFCRIDRKGGGWHANHGGLYDTIFYPMAKAVTARLNELPKSGESED